MKLGFIEGKVLESIANGNLSEEDVLDDLSDRIIIPISILRSTLTRLYKKGLITKKRL